MALDDKPWGVRALALVGGATLLSFCTGESLLFAALKRGWLTEAQLASAEMVMQGFSLYVVGVAVLCGYLRWRGISLEQAFGLSRHTWAKGVARGILLFCGVLPLVLTFTFLWMEALQAFGVVPQEQDTLKLFRAVDSPLWRGYFVVLSVMMAPVFEESVFRGFLYPVLRRALGIAGGLIAVSVIFALVHFNLTVFGPLVMLALLLAIAYEMTGNLLVPIVIHGLFNTVTLLVQFAMPEP